ncbi:MAG: hypothetical protein CBB68_08180 [Rhodospirillaceae bacterium TMED8]|nr:MAG: hypothetical protein CBB68_08180 [Rhodospirillaceae bacterium TMED8]
MKNNYLMDLLVTKNEVAIDLINDGISKYPGPCPCPYNVDVNRANCGNRSVWSRSGGKTPHCYVKDYSNEYLEVIRRQILLSREGYE